MIRVLAILLAFAAAPAWAQEPIKIGLVTALSGQSARAGEAITRGLQVAIDEINARGGLRVGNQSRKLELLRRDDESIPAKGVIAARELYFREKVAVLIGGLDSPVALAIVPIANETNVALPANNMPAMAIITVRPETSTARPEVAAAASSAADGLRPASRSSISRRT